MKISFNSAKHSYHGLDPSHGFGNAGIQILDTLKSLGYSWSFNDPTADVGFVFNHPSGAQFFPHQYNILYFPWESTEVFPGWKGVMDGVDELWTPSPWCADIFKTITNSPVYVYEHGIDHSWKAVKHERHHPLRFLHQGAEAARKDGWTTWDNIKLAFPGVDDVQYTMKYIKIHQMPNFLHASTDKWIKVHGDMPLSKLQKLYNDNDVYVYPSRGEGFGLTPLQALASGMPVITVKEWAPYKDFLDPDLTLSGTLVTSSWEVHPGKVYRIDQAELIERLRFAYNNYEQVSARAYDMASKVHEAYDWTTLTKKAFGDLERRLNS